MPGFYCVLLNLWGCALVKGQCTSDQLDSFKAWFQDLLGQVLTSLSSHSHLASCVPYQPVCLTLLLHGLQPTRLLCPWDYSSNSAGVGCHFLLQGIFPTQGLWLLHWQADSLPLIDLGSPQDYVVRLLNITLLRSHYCFHSFSCVLFSANPWTAACQASLSFTISQSLLKLMSVESVMLSNHLILCHPLLFLPSIFLSIKVFSNESVLRIRWPVYWSLALASVLPMIIQDWCPLGWTVWSSCCPRNSQKSSPAPQFEGISSSVPNLSNVQLSYPYMTTRKKHSFDYTGLCRQSNVSAFWCTV